MIEPVTLIITIAYLCSPLVMIFLVYWFYIRKGKVRIKIMRKYKEGYRVIKTIKRISLSNLTHSYKDKSYNLDITKAILDEHNRPELFYDESDAEPLSFFDNKNPKDSKIFDKVLKSEVYSKFLSRYRDKYYIIIIVVLICAVVGLAVFTSYLYNKQNEQILLLLSQMAKIDNGVIIR